MLNTTRLKIKSKATLKMTMDMFQNIGEKYSKGTEEAIEDIRKNIQAMEMKLRDNDIEINRMTRQHELNDKKVQQQHYVTEKQRRIAEEEMRKLSELEATESGMKKTNERLQTDMAKIKQTQSKIQAQYLRLIEDLAELESGGNREEIKLLNAPKDNGASFFKRKLKEENKDYKVVVRGNVFDHKDVAESIRMKMYMLLNLYGEHEEVKNVLAKTDETLQFKFKDLRYGNSIEVKGVYYFKTSANTTYTQITMLREEMRNGKKHIVKIADGEKVFVPVNETEKMDEYNEIAHSALKTLKMIEFKIQEEIQKDNEEVLVMFENKSIVLNK